MYRFDHQAIRTIHKKRCVTFCQDALGYRIADEFTIVFDEEKNDVAVCTVLEPSNRVAKQLPWSIQFPIGCDLEQEYVLAPEIFVSEGTPGSIVHEWAANRGGAGIHHVALQCPEGTTVEEEMKKWIANGWVDGFSTEAPIVCNELTQVFSMPSVMGVIFELIERKEFGFCRTSVRDLMLSSKEFK